MKKTEEQEEAKRLITEYATNIRNKAGDTWEKSVPEVDDAFLKMEAWADQILQQIKKL